MEAIDVICLHLGGLFPAAFTIEITVAITICVLQVYGDFHSLNCR